MRTNMLISRYSKCSINVKLTLFRSYCMSLYDIGIQKHFTVTAFNKFRSCYNRCIKKFFGYNRSDSMSLLKLPSADTIIVHNSRRLFVQQCVMSCSNNIVQWFEAIDVQVVQVFIVFSYLGIYGLLSELNMMDGWMDNLYNSHQVSSSYTIFIETRL